MKKLVAAVFLMFMTSWQSAFSALPPLYQSLAEINKLLSDSQLTQHLGSPDVILEIKRNDRGYEIVTNDHRLQADIVYEPVKRPGPLLFHFVFHEAIPLEENK